MASSTRNQGSVRAPFVNINQLTRSGASNGDVPVFNSPRWGVGEGGGGGGGAAQITAPNYPIGDGIASEAVTSGATFDLLEYVGLEAEEIGTSATLPNATVTLTPGDHTGKFAITRWPLQFTNATIPPGSVWGVKIRYSGVTGIDILTFSLETGSGAFFDGGMIDRDGAPGQGDLPWFGKAMASCEQDAGVAVLFVDTPFNQETASVRLVAAALSPEGAMTDPASFTIDSVEYIPFPVLKASSGGGGDARYIEPFLAFEFGPITDAIWEMVPPGVLFWCQAGEGGEGRMTRGFYRTDGTSTVVRDESYDVDAPFTVIHVLHGLYEDLSDFVDRQPYRGTSLLWVFSDWNATKEMPTYHVGTTAELVTVDYEPENYTLSGGDGSNSVGAHLAGIDNAIGGVKVVTEIELDAWDYEVKPGDRHVYFDPSIDHAYTVGVSGLLGGVAFQETWLYNDSAVFNLEVETAFLVSPGQAMHIIWNGTTYTAHVLDAPTAL